MRKSLTLRGRYRLLEFMTARVALELERQAPLPVMVAPKKADAGYRWYVVPVEMPTSQRAAKRLALNVAQEIVPYLLQAGVTKYFHEDPLIFAPVEALVCTRAASSVMGLSQYIMSRDVTEFGFRVSAA